MPAANDRMQLAIIGFGKRAHELHGGFLDDEGIEIVSIAEVAAARARSQMPPTPDERQMAHEEMDAELMLNWRTEDGARSWLEPELASEKDGESVSVA